MNYTITPEQVLAWCNSQPTTEPDPRGPCPYRRGWFDYDKQRWIQLEQPPQQS